MGQVLVRRFGDSWRLDEAVPIGLRETQEVRSGEESSTSEPSLCERGDLPLKGTAIQNRLRRSASLLHLQRYAWWRHGLRRLAGDPLHPTDASQAGIDGGRLSPQLSDGDQGVNRSVPQFLPPKRACCPRVSPRVARPQRLEPSRSALSCRERPDDALYSDTRLHFGLRFQGRVGLRGHQELSSGVGTRVGPGTSGFPPWPV